MMRTLDKYVAIVPVLVVYLILFLVGQNVPGMWQLMATLLFYCAIGQAFNIFLGMTGYVDFGYVAFIGMGTYGMAVTVNTMAGSWLGGYTIFLGYIMTLVFAGLLSLAVGAVALRLRGAYFAIATIGVNEGLRFFIEGVGLWGGSEGIIFMPELNQVLGKEAASAMATYWADVLVIIIAVLAAVTTIAYMRSKIGYALTALREDEDAARVMGINVTKFKILAFMTSACFAGLVGATAWALKTPYVFPPEVFEIHYTIECIIIVMLGGAGTLLGPVVGGLIYGIGKYVLSVVFPGFQLLIFAPLIIIIIVAFPDGVVGGIRNKVAHTRLGRFIL